jgi:hypothetical protein
MNYTVLLIDEDGDRYIYDTVFSSRKKLNKWAKEKWHAFKKVKADMNVISDKITGVIGGTINGKYKVLAIVYPVTIA